RHCFSPAPRGKVLLSGQPRDRITPTSRCLLAQGKTAHTRTAMNSIQLKYPLQKRYLSLLSLAATVMSVMTVASFCPTPALSAPKVKLTGTWGTILGSQVYVRIRPSSSSPNVAKLPRSTKVMAWGTYQGWYRVE